MDKVSVLIGGTMNYEFRPRGVCSQRITLEVEGDRVSNVKFTGGCHGNLQGIARLVEGMTVSEVIERLSGIRCGFKQTSCPDQLAKALSSIEGAN